MANMATLSDVAIILNVDIRMTIRERIKAKNNQNGVTMDDKKHTLLGYEPGTDEPVYKYVDDFGDYKEYGVNIDKSDEIEYSAIVDEVDYELMDLDEALSFIYSNRERVNYRSSKWFKPHCSIDRKNRHLGFDPIFHWPVLAHLVEGTNINGSKYAYEEDVLGEESWYRLDDRLFKSNAGSLPSTGKKYQRLLADFYDDSYCNNPAQKTYKEMLYAHIALRGFMATRRLFLIVSDSLDNDDVEAIKVLGYEPKHNLPVYLVSGKYIDLIQVGENRRSKYMPIVKPIPPNEIINGVSFEKALELVGDMVFKPVPDDLVEKVKNSEGVELTRIIFEEIFKDCNDSNRSAQSVAKAIPSSNDRYVIHDIDQRSDEWYKLRDGKVTGSQAYLLKNHSLDYIIERSHGQSSGYTSEAARRGLNLEREGIDAFARLNNVEVGFVGFVTSKHYALAGCSPDGVIYDENLATPSIKTIIEHKAFGAEHHLACHENIDDKVMYQIQFNMFITGASDAYLILYNPDMPDKSQRLFIHKILPDEEIYRLFEAKLR